MRIINKMNGRRHRNFYTFKNYLDKVYEHHTKHEWDTPIIIMGNEGRGKSNLALHLFDYWTTLKNGEVKAEDIEQVNLNARAWVKANKSLEECGCSVFDEAGQLSNKRAMSNFNVAVDLYLQVVRKKKLFNVFVLPSIWSLPSDLLSRRFKGFFYVYKRGCFKFFNAHKMKRILLLSQGKIYHRERYLNTVKPSFVGRFGVYKGVLKEPYEKRKDETIQQAAEELNKTVFGDGAKDNPHLNQRNKLIFHLADGGKPNREIAELVGLSDRMIRNILHERKRQGEKEDTALC